MGEEEERIEGEREWGERGGGREWGREWGERAEERNFAYNPNVK